LRLQRSQWTEEPSIPLTEKIEGAAFSKGEESPGDQSLVEKRQAFSLFIDQSPKAAFLARDHPS